MIRSHSVMLDSDLAKTYGVTTKRLNEQYRRNRGRFPKDFAFQLTAQELTHLRSQIATAKMSRYRPTVFTEHGAIMLASVLNSKVAIAASVTVVRAFVAMREVISRNKQLQDKLAEIEGRLDGHDESLQELFAAIHQLLDAPENPEEDEPRREIGFHVKNARKGKDFAVVGI